MRAILFLMTVFCYAMTIVQAGNAPAAIPVKAEISGIYDTCFYYAVSMPNPVTIGLFNITGVNVRTKDTNSTGYPFFEPDWDYSVFKIVCFAECLNGGNSCNSDGSGKYFKGFIRVKGEGFVTDSVYFSDLRQYGSLRDTLLLPSPFIAVDTMSPKLIVKGPSSTILYAGMQTVCTTAVYDNSRLLRKYEIDSILGGSGKRIWLDSAVVHPYLKAYDTTGHYVDTVYNGVRIPRYFKRQIVLTVPNIVTTQYKLKIKVTDNYGNAKDTTIGPYTIQDTTHPTTSINNLPAILQAKAATNITWTASDNIGITSWTLMWSKDGGTTYSQLTTGTSGNSYSWTPTTVELNNKIKIVVSDGSNNKDSAVTAVFQIKDLVPPTVSAVTVTNAQEGLQATIAWTASDDFSIGSRVIYLSTNNGSSYSTLDSTAYITNSWTWNVPSTLIATQCVIKVKVYDINGNACLNPAISSTFSVTDITAPTVSTVGVTGTLTVNSQATFTWSASDNSGTLTSWAVYLSTDAGSTYTKQDSGAYGTSYTWTVPSTLIATCQVQVRVYDPAGNKGVGLSSTFITSDGEVPTLSSLSVPTNLHTGSHANITWTGNDNLGLVSRTVALLTGGVVTVLDSGIYSSSYMWNIPDNYVSTSCRIQVRAYDGNHNRAISTTPVFTVTDTIPPTTPIITLPGDVCYTGRPFIITWTATDNIGITARKITLNDGSTVDSGSYTAGTFTWNVPQKLMTSKFGIRVYDAAGNSSYAESGSFTVRDTTKPVLTVNSIDTNVSVGSKHPLTWTCSDNLGTVSVAIYLVNGTTTRLDSITGTSYEWTAPIAGRYHFLLRAYDGSGNVTESTSKEFTTYLTTEIRVYARAIPKQLELQLVKGMAILGVDKSEMTTFRVLDTKGRVLVSYKTSEAGYHTVSMDQTVSGRYIAILSRAGKQVLRPAILF